MTPCIRCGRADGRHVGYHDDSELPIRRGDRVRVRTGAEIRTTLPGPPSRRRLVNKRPRFVTVHHMDCGRSDVTGYTHGASTPIYQHVDDPGVVWVGTGGYWHSAKLCDVEKVELAFDSFAELAIDILKGVK